jgi:hypothetical protein
VWIQGPYPAHKYTNINIFDKVFWNFLEPSKLVEANKGYRSQADKAKCPQNDTNPGEKQVMQQRRVRACHESLNRQLKNWGIPSQVFCHHISWHSNVFWACVVVMQFTIKNSELLFEVRIQR